MICSGFPNESLKWFRGSKTVPFAHRKRLYTSACRLNKSGHRWNLSIIWNTRLCSRPRSGCSGKKGRRFILGTRVRSCHFYKRYQILLLRGNRKRSLVALVTPRGISALHIRNDGASFFLRKKIKVNPFLQTSDPQVDQGLNNFQKFSSV